MTKLATLFRTTLAATALAAVAAPAMADDHMENPMVGGAAMSPEKTIVENAVNSADHETLVAAVKQAGLVDTLSGEGPFTVFAPTDASTYPISVVGTRMYGVRRR